MRKSISKSVTKSSEEVRASLKFGSIAPDPQDFKALAEYIPNLAWMANADGWIFWYNPRWYEYTGKRPEQMAGWGWQSVHDPKELPRVLKQWKASLDTGEPFEMEFPLLSAQGKFRWFLTRVHPHKGPDGRVLRWFGTNTDIHDLKLAQDAQLQSERHLRLNEERFTFTQKAAKIASWEYHFDEERFLWTPEVFELFGQDLHSFHPTLKNVLHLMYYATDRDEFQKSLQRSLTSRRKQLETHFRISRPNDDVRFITARGKSFFNQGTTLLLGVFVDVTAVQQAFRATS